MLKMVVLVAHLNDNFNNNNSSHSNSLYLNIHGYLELNLFNMN